MTQKEGKETQTIHQVSLPVEKKFDTFENERHNLAFDTNEENRSRLPTKFMHLLPALLGKTHQTDPQSYQKSQTNGSLFIGTRNSDERVLQINVNDQQEDDILPDDAKEGLFNIRAIFFLVLWYFFSGCTLFMNKYIMMYMHGDPTVLGAFQMLMTTTCGLIQMYVPCGMYKIVKRRGRPPGFFKHMVLVGSMRFTTVLLGLIALNYVAVSFTETIKSSAPLFTVLISRILLGEHTGFYVNLSLIPVMSGLVLCSANELSFDFRGFMAAIATNITECFQNVYSKMLISGHKFKYTPAELQFYTSMASVVVQIPASFFLIDFAHVQKTTDFTVLTAFLLNGLFFHFQSITAYVLMDYINPVTHSVANTAKRAFLIWLSVVLFGNPVTVLSGLGTATVILGVLLYNKARNYDTVKRLQERVIEITPQKLTLHR